MDLSFLRYFRGYTRAVIVLPGDGFEHLTDETICAYLVDEDGRILETVLTTSQFEPIDDVSEFFLTCIRNAVYSSDDLDEQGILPVEDPQRTIVRFVLDDVPAWQKSVYMKRIQEQFRTQVLS